MHSITKDANLKTARQLVRLLKQFILPMQKKPLISVITVAFNAEKLIGKTLESIKNQSFSDFEYLVIDGASKDDTLKIINKAEIPSTRILSEPDRGLYDAMNKGLRLAEGSYVLFLNAGDAFHDSDSLARYAAEAKKNRDIIYGDTDIISPDGSRIGGRHLSAPDVLTHKSFAKGMLICHQAFMVKKDLAPEYDLKYRFSADYDWCVKCIKKSDPNNCINLNAVVIDYLSDGLTDKNKWKSLRERFRSMSVHYGFLPTSIRHLSFIFRALKRGKL